MGPGRKVCTVHALEFLLGELNVTSRLVGHDSGRPSGQYIHRALRMGPDLRIPTLRRLVL